MRLSNREKRALFNAIEDIRQDVHENNVMLRQICKVINTHLSRHHQENSDDFVRNVLANMLSTGMESVGFLRR